MRMDDLHALTFELNMFAETDKSAMSTHCRKTRIYVTVLRISDGGSHSHAQHCDPPSTLARAILPHSYILAYNIYRVLLCALYSFNSVTD